MKKAKIILKIVGIDTFIAVKNQWNKCYDHKPEVLPNKFYNMLARRLKERKSKNEVESMAYFLKNELHYHYKEYSQYQ